MILWGHSNLNLNILEDGFIMPRAKTVNQETNPADLTIDEILLKMSGYQPKTTGVSAMTSMKRNIGISFDENGDQAPEKFDVVIEAIIVSRIPKWVNDFCSDTGILVPDAVRAINENMSRMIVYYRYAIEAYYNGDFDGFAASAPQFYSIPKAGDNEGECLMIFGPIVDKFGRYANTTLTDGTDHVIFIEQLANLAAMYDFVTALSHDVDYNVDGGFPYRGTVHGSAVRPNKSQSSPSNNSHNEAHSGDSLDDGNSETVQLEYLSDVKKLDNDTTFRAAVSRIELDGEFADVFGFTNKGTVARMTFVRTDAKSAAGDFVRSNGQNGVIGFSQDNAPFLVATKTVSTNNGNSYVSYKNVRLEVN